MHTFGFEKIITADEWFRRFPGYGLWAIYHNGKPWMIFDTRTDADAYKNQMIYPRKVREECSVERYPPKPKAQSGKSSQFT